MRNCFTGLAFCLLRCDCKLGADRALRRLRRAEAARASYRGRASPRRSLKPRSGNMTCTLFPDKAPIGVAELHRARHWHQRLEESGQAEPPSMAYRSTMAPFFTV